MLDPYATLGIPPTASQAEVEVAFRRRQLFLHPDRTATLSTGEQQPRQRCSKTSWLHMPCSATPAYGRCSTPPSSNRLGLQRRHLPPHSRLRQKIARALQGLLHRRDLSPTSPTSSAAVVCISRGHHSFGTQTPCCEPGASKVSVERWKTQQAGRSWAHLGIAFFVVSPITEVIADHLPSRRPVLRRTASSASLRSWCSSSSSC